MSAAPLAAAAAALAVLALWEALATLERTRARRVLARALVAVAGGTCAGGPPAAGEPRRLALVAAAACASAGALVMGPIGAIACGVGGPCAAGALLRQRRRRYRERLERGAPAVARAIADALAAGHSVAGALVEAARGLDGAAGDALRGVASQIAFGEPTDVALERLRATADLRAYDTLVAAILLQREAGGDLAALLRELARTQEDALRLVADARAATAQARFTGLIVTGMPVGAAALAELGRPGALSLIAQQPLAAYLAAFAVVLQAVAFVVIRRLARVVR